MDNSLQVRLITAESDIPQLARVKTAAFKNYSLHASMYPVENGSIMQTFNEERERLELFNPSQSIVAVVDTSSGSSRIIAYARWHIPLQVVNKQQTASANLSAVDKSRSAPSTIHTTRPPAPEGTNIPLYTTFLESLGAMRSMHWDKEKDYMLGSLATHPSHRGRGCASKLLDWGVKEADRNKARIYLESTPEAHGLYQRFGLYDIDEIRFNLADFGGGEVLILKTMVRDPRVDKS